MAGISLQMPIGSAGADIYKTFQEVCKVIANYFVY